MRLFGKRSETTLPKKDGAYYEMPETYAHNGPVFTPLFDDPVCRQETWQRVQERIEEEAKLTPEQLAAVYRHVAELGIQAGLYTEPHPRDIPFMNAGQEA